MFQGSFSNIQCLVLDEGDKMLNMGFIPDIRRIVTDPEMPPKEKRQTLMFCATFPPAIKNIAQEFLHNYLFLTIGVFGGACSNVKQAFHQLGGCHILSTCDFF